MWLCENAIGPVGAAAIADLIQANHTLCTLDLDDCNIGPAGSTRIAAAVAKNPQFTKLGLNGNTVPAEAVDQLVKSLVAHGSQLQGLSLSRTTMPPGGAHRILQALEKNSSLVGLNLSGNSVNDACIEQLAKVLGTHGKLAMIEVAMSDTDVQGSKFGDSCVSALADAMESNLVVHTINDLYADNAVPGDRIHNYMLRNRRVGPLLAGSVAAIDLLNRHVPNSHWAVSLPPDQANFVATTTVRHMAIHSETYKPVLEALSHGIMGMSDPI